LKSGLELQFELEKGKKLNFAGTCIYNMLILQEFRVLGPKGEGEAKPPVLFLPESEEALSSSLDQLEGHLGH
jgi:hypothetical protein